jgi:galactose mutarotase-like enzyme
MYTIKNELLSIGVKPAGAELCSIKNVKSDAEYIWQADPEIWSSHAPNLFPVIGVLKDGSYYYDSEKYVMPKHGFIRHNENIRLKEQTKDKLTFQLEYSEESLKIYPFKFRFEISFSLDKNILTVNHKIENQDEKPLYFSLGGHPAFNAPLFEGETYEDYYLEFDQKQDLNTFLLSKNGLVGHETSVVTENDDTIQLHRNLFDHDALIFKNIASKKVSLKSKKSGAILTVRYQDFNNLGIWAKPKAPFVCIEPWLGIADVEGTNQDLKTKEGIMELMPSGKFVASYSIEIE